MCLTNPKIPDPEHGDCFTEGEHKSFSIMHRRLVNGVVL